MTITIKNEAAIIRDNLLYHRFLGIEIFYIFTDGTTDDSVEHISDLPYVVILPSVPAGWYQDRTEFKVFVKRSADLFTARQSLNTYCAMTLARQRGLDWIIALDADELICLDFNRGGNEQLLRFFKGVPERFDVIRFQTLEVVQRRFEYENVFRQETLFKRWKSSIRRRIYNPFSDEICRLRGFYGHDSGKSALRLTVDAIPRTSHEFVSRSGKKLKTLKCGYLLHYYCYSFSDFQKKFRNMIDHPETYIHGDKVAYVPKMLWRDIVNHPDYNERFLQRYFKEWIMFKESDLLCLRQKHYLGIIPRSLPVLEIVSVRIAFEHMREAGTL